MVEMKVTEVIERNENGMDAENVVGRLEIMEWQPETRNEKVEGHRKVGCKNGYSKRV